MVTKLIKVTNYKAKKNGKLYKVHAYKRKHRKQGRLKKYTKVGYFLLGHDKYGNIKGSKITPIKQPSVPKKSTTNIDKEFAKGKIDYKTWAKKS